MEFVATVKRRFRVSGVDLVMDMTNLERMIALAEQFFDTKNDPDQIIVDTGVIEKLRSVHPAAVGETADENGPIAWMIVIPSTHQAMKEFIRRKIGERQLLEAMAPGFRYDALYLCSALVLPEHRGRGLARRLAGQAIRAIQSDHPIKELFYWSFSEEGTALAETIAREFRLPVYRREAGILH
jgi:hypothetical protein